MPSKPKPAESKASFVNRCMIEYAGEYPDAEERQAFCSMTYEEAMLTRGELRPNAYETEDAFFQRVFDNGELRQLYPSSAQLRGYARQWWKKGPKRG